MIYENETIETNTSMKLLNNATLEQSSTVANCLMNRERVCTGKNSYVKELSFDVLDFIRQRSDSHNQVTWIDLCCGSGKALIDAASKLSNDDLNPMLSIIGIDLVSMFD